MIHGRATFGRTACFECSHTKAASFARVSLPQADGHVASSKDAAPCLACSCAVLQLLVSCTSRGQPRGRAAALPPRPAARPLSPLPSPPALLPPPATAAPPSPPPPPGASVIPASRAALTTRVARSSAARRRPRRQYRQPRQAPMPRTSTWKGGWGERSGGGKQQAWLRGAALGGARRDAMAGNGSVGPTPATQLQR